MQLKYVTTLPIEFYTRDPSSHDTTWHPLEHGPSIIHFEPDHEISIRMRNIDDAILKKLVEEVVEIKQLTYLNLSENRKITDKGCEYISRLSDLSHLNLSSCDISNAGLKTISLMKSLKSLDITFCNRVTDAGILFLRALTGLEFLDLQGLPKITNGSLSKIKRKNLHIHR